MVETYYLWDFVVKFYSIWRWPTLRWNAFKYKYYLCSSIPSLLSQAQYLAVLVLFILFQGILVSLTPWAVDKQPCYYPPPPHPQYFCNRPSIHWSTRNSKCLGWDRPPPNTSHNGFNVSLLPGRVEGAPNSPLCNKGNWAVESSEREGIGFDYFILKVKNKY